MTGAAGRVARRPVVPGRVAFAVALFLAAGFSLAPSSARPVAAATGTLVIVADATYSVEPSAGLIHVSVAVALTNDKPSSASYSYYWRDIAWAVQPEAVNLMARDETGDLAITSTPQDGYLESEVRLRRNLNYRQTANVTISWDLPGGTPRSDSAIRVGEAFVAFDVWAWGDAGNGSVTVRLPAGFEVQTSGSQLAEETGPGGATLTAAAIDDPFEFWATVAGTRDRSFATDALTLPGSIRLVVKGWPEDAVWRTTVSTTLRRGLPDLQTLIGLPWPVARQLEVLEVYAPLLEGYSGFFYPDEERIEISEELDELTIIHEGAHAWFNDGLFTERWITEGLADTYAAAVLAGLGSEHQTPQPVRTTDEGHVDLLSWQFPGRITDETALREEYGYNASWYVVATLYEEIGSDRFRAIFKAAHDDAIAYEGSGPPETVGETDDWRRFLDLLEEAGGSARAVALYRTLVVSPPADRELDARDDARAAYDGLLAAGDGWSPPFYVRSQMGTWSFERATDRIAEALAVLSVRAEVQDAATALGIDAPDLLRAAYESASDGFAAAQAVGADELEALGALAALANARDTIAREPDLVLAVGLLETTPDLTYEEAVAAFEAGDLDAAVAGALGALAAIDDAPRIGRERLLATTGGAAVVVLVVGFFVLRHRRRRGVPDAAGGVAGGAAEPYATLAAGPSAESPPTVGVPEQDGGSVGGDGSSTPH
ncbi:MAG: hypothetical protein HW391_1408 [Chloroflexi bacterium]|nr:hypothetical protein [Chloroflexota bacterium]